MTVEALSEPIVAAFEGWVKGLLTRLLAAPETTLAEVVQEVADGLRQVTRAVVSAAVRCVGHHQVGPVCRSCGVTMRSKGWRERYLFSELGELRVPVRRYRCPGCGASSSPKLEEDGVAGRWTSRMREVALRLATAMPYRWSEQVLSLLGCPVSDTTLQRVAMAEGRRRVAARQAELERWERLEGVPRLVERPERLYQQVDGCKTYVLGQGWREPRVGVFYETAACGVDVEGKGPPVKWRRMVANIEKAPEDEVQADSFMRLVGLELDRCGARYAQEVVSLSDGAEWIWERMASGVPMRTKHLEILDFYHAAENLARAVRAVYGGDEAGFKARYGRLRGWLSAGDTQAVLGDLEVLLAKADEAAADEVRKVLAYVRKNRHRMDYGRLKLDGYDIGSGAVESACKQLLARVRGPGMRWREDHLEAMLALRADFLTEETQPQAAARAA